MLPKNDDDLLNLSEAYTNLDNGERFLLSAEKLNDGVALIFMSSFGKEILQHSNDWAMDGTFATCPEGFSQIYVVFGYGGTEKIFPCAYILLPAKNTTCYNHAFTTLKSFLEDTTPTSITIDFEQAVIRTIKTVFPVANIRGCKFHFKKSIFANVGFKGCLPLFYESEQFQTGLELVYALTYLPPEFVLHAWETVVKPYFHKHFEENGEVQDFILYCERNWIGGRRAPTFPIEMWNCYERVLQDRPDTNNAVESWNARWAASLGTNHNVLRVIDGFKKENSLAQMKYREVIGGRYVDPNPGRTAKKLYRYNELKLAIQNCTRYNVKIVLYNLTNVDL